MFDFERVVVVLLRLINHWFMAKKWTETKIREAVNLFFSKNERFPTQHDFQFNDYLPDPHTIRRLYGGLPAFRKKLGYNIVNYSKGEERSGIVRSLNERGKTHEREVYSHLVQQFGEICVHTEKEFSFRNRVDFYIYHKQGIFGADTFFPKHRSALVNIYNLKEKKYRNFNGIVYLVSMNPVLSQPVLDDYLKNKKHKNAAHIKLLSKDVFLKEIRIYSRMEKFI